MPPSRAGIANRSPPSPVCGATPDLQKARSFASLVDPSDRLRIHAAFCSGVIRASARGSAAMRTASSPSAAATRALSSSSSFCVGCGFGAA
jgi:hypothetical protein